MKEVQSNSPITASSVDRITVFKDAIFAQGWASISSEKLSLIIDGERIEAHRKIYERPDLVEIYGESARFWGFSATFVAESVDQASKAVNGDIFIVSNSGDIRANGIGKHAGEKESLQHSALTNAFFEEYGLAKNPYLLEIGSRARSGLTRRELFPDCNYIGLDVLDGPNVDIVGDAHELSSLIKTPIDFVFSISVFEHLLMPWKVISELSKIMNKGGLVYIQTHQTWPVHDAPCDFWRFSKDCWPALFNSATGFEVLNTAYFEPMNVTPAFELGNPATRFGDSLGYGGVSVLARATGISRLSWDISVKDVLSSSYPA